MPALPWVRRADPDPTARYVVLASRLPLRHYRDLPRFLRATLAIRRQLAGADGLIGYSLDAHLLGKTFYTLSAWTDAAALDRFAHGDPHADRVSDLRPRIAPTTLVTWEAEGSAVPVGWAQAREHITAAGTHPG